jgi:hypothetical protein
MRGNVVPRPASPALNWIAVGVRKGSASHCGRLDRQTECILIAVGTLITERPPHRSGRARFGHPAPTSGA